MRLTLTLSKDIAARLKAEAQHSGRSLKDVVDECLQERLAPRAPAQSPGRFSVKPCDFGSVRPGIALDTVGELPQ